MAASPTILVGNLKPCWPRPKPMSCSARWRNLYIASAARPMISRKGSAVAPRRAHQQEFFGSKNCSSAIPFQRVIHLASSAVHDSMRSQIRESKAEDLAWTADWKGTVVADDKAFVTEIAIHGKSGSGRCGQKSSSIEFSNEHWLSSGEALRYLRREARRLSEAAVALDLGTPPPPPNRRPTNAAISRNLTTSSGQRVFDVAARSSRAQGFVSSAKPARSPQSPGAGIQKVMALDALTLEFIPSAGSVTADTAPVLSGFEL